jgi:hypothetical protein
VPDPGEERGRNKQQLNKSYRSKAVEHKKTMCLAVPACGGRNGDRGDAWSGSISDAGTRCAARAY